MGKGRLLIVEDDTDISTMLQIFFKGLHYEVDIAARGSDARCGSGAATGGTRGAGTGNRRSHKSR